MSTELSKRGFNDIGQDNPADFYANQYAYKKLNTMWQKKYFYFIL